MCWRGTALASTQLEEELGSEVVSPLKTWQVIQFGQSASLMACGGEAGAGRGVDFHEDDSLQEVSVQEKSL